MPGSSAAARRRTPATIFQWGWRSGRGTRPCALRPAARTARIGHMAMCPYRTAPAAWRTSCAGRAMRTPLGVPRGRATAREGFLGTLETIRRLGEAQAADVAAGRPAGAEPGAAGRAEPRQPAGAGAAEAGPGRVGGARTGGRLARARDHTDPRRRHDGADRPGLAEP